MQNIPPNGRGLRYVTL